MELNQQTNPKNPPPRTNPIHNLLQYLDKRMEIAVRERANRLIAKMQPKLDANLKAAWDDDDRERAEKTADKAAD